MSLIKTNTWTRKSVAAGSSLTIVIGLVMAGAANHAHAVDGETDMTIKLIDSNGVPLAGASAKYYGKANGSSASNWHDFGTTGADGKITKAITPGKITFQLTYKHTQQSKTMTVSGDSGQVDFQTTTATVSVTDSDGAPLQGVAPAYYGTATAWQPMALTGADGTSTVEVLPSSISFEVQYKGGREVQKLAIDGPTTIDFQTKPVTLRLEDQNGNPVADGNFSHYGLAVGGWVQHGLSGANGTIETELLNGTYTVHMTFDKKLQKATVVVASAATGHTFVVEVATPEVPGDNNGGNGEDENNNDQGENPGDPKTPQDPTNPDENGEGDNPGSNEGENEGGNGGENEGGNGGEETPIIPPIDSEEIVDGESNGVAPQDEDSPSESAVVGVEDGRLPPVVEAESSDDGSNAGTDDQLAKTGAADSAAIGLTGAVAVAAGLILMLMGRRKEDQAS